MQEGIRHAAAGSYERKVPGHHTNIALLSTILLDYAGSRFEKRVWLEHAEKMAQYIIKDFRKHDAYREYNSPTYYGTDLIALSLWRRYASSSMLRDGAAKMQQTLWTDVGRFYHAGMRNLCGPYSRSYGMNITHYASLLGMWIAPAVSSYRAPIPDVRQPFVHTADYCWMPFVAWKPKIPSRCCPAYRFLVSQDRSITR